ncbi:hypothetical protein D3C72_1580390 [compost metagenome]
MGKTNGHQPSESQQQSPPLPGLGALTQQRCSQQQRKKRLRLHDHRGHARRHAQLQTQEQKAELPQPLRQPVAHHKAPGHGWAGHEQQKRQGCRSEPQGTQQHGAEPLQAQLHHHKVQPPDDHHGQRAQQVATAQCPRRHAATAAAAATGRPWRARAATKASNASALVLPGT